MVPRVIKSTSTDVAEITPSAFVSLQRPGEPGENVKSHARRRHRTHLRHATELLSCGCAKGWSGQAHLFCSGAAFFAPCLATNAGVASCACCRSSSFFASTAWACFVTVASACRTAGARLLLAWWRSVEGTNRMNAKVAVAHAAGVTAPTLPLWASEPHER